MRKKQKQKAPQIKKILFFVGWSMSIRREDINKYVLN